MPLSLDSPKAQRRLVAAIVVATLLPFVGKAFHIDDPLFVWIGKHIVDHPLDPYGFQVNWALTPRSVAEITKNPPLTSYLIAAVGSVAGWSEITLHVAFLLPAVALGLGTLELARRLCARPFLAFLVSWLTPVTVLTASGVTCDVLMLALCVWALVLWRDGRLWTAMTLAGVAAWTKYFGAAFLLLFVLDALLRRTPLRRWAPPLVVPVAMLAAYQAWTSHLYGRGLLLDAAAYATDWRAGENIPLLDRALMGLSFTGGCMLAALAFAPWLWKVRGWIAAAGVAVIAAYLIATRATMIADTERLAVGVHAAFFVAGGLSLLALAIDDWRREKSPDAALLAAWVVGTFVFASFVNWTINGRSILPLVPAAAILIVRRLPERPRWMSAAAIAVSAIVTLVVTVGDVQLADAGREASGIVRAKAAGRTARFEGHWGFQYYMESWGAKPLDMVTAELNPGDVVAFGYSNTQIVGLPKSKTGPTDRFEVGSTLPASTMRSYAGAGFYASVFGPLPYRLGAMAPERYSMIEVK
ncbi:MAG TPA: hypothetical protein VFV19_10820 [Candidatus Polarisedimenticolaceae bacterium]|nr:hypothetical protein [Candidatus Polarisedimenticolaceae bacterium]